MYLGNLDEIKNDKTTFDLQNNDTLSRLTQATICTNIHVQFAFVNITNFVRQNTNLRWKICCNTAAKLNFWKFAAMQIKYMTTSWAILSSHLCTQ